MLLVFGGLLVLAGAILVLGAHVPTIPWISVFGSVSLSYWSAWIIAALLLGALLIWSGDAGTPRTVLLILATLAILGAAIVPLRQASVAGANGVKLSLADTFGLGGILKSASPDETLTYGQDLGEDLLLDVYRPAGQAPAGGWPVLMYVHGGGWVEGSKSMRNADLRWFADHGWLVVAIDYSLSGKERHLWDRATRQVGCAMAWVAKSSGSYSADPQRLALIGDSAGGNLVINAAYLANVGRLQSTCGGAVPRVAAVSAVYPGVDLVAINANRYTPTGPGVSSMTEKYIGGPPAQFPDRYKAVASGTHIDPTAPPTLVFIAEHDHLVPLASVNAFVEAARKGGVKIEAISMPYAEHGFDVTGIGNKVVRQATLRFINTQTVDAPTGTAAP